jgi:hypothetical protein
VDLVAEEVPEEVPGEDKGGGFPPPSLSRS